MTAPLAMFRCDASPTIGAGHVTRCLALAEEFISAGWRVTFAVRDETEKIVAALVVSGIEVRQLACAPDAEAAELTRALPDGCDLLVIDHYHRDETFERACRAFARSILVLDDCTGRQHDCDVLVDAAATDPSAYDDLVPRTARVLTGPRFAPVRHAFRARRKAALARRGDGPVETILVSFGATDPCNATPIALDALNGIAGAAKVTVALSDQAPHIAEVRARVGQRVHLVLDAPDMAELMMDADLAIGAAGATAYERACLGLPSILVTLADNQRGIADLLLGAGAAVEAGTLGQGLAPRIGAHVRDLSCNGQTRVRMARAASALVDGAGSHRVANAVMELAA